MKKVYALLGMAVISMFFVSPLVSCSTLRNTDARQIYLQHWGISDTVEQGNKAASASNTGEESSRSAGGIPQTEDR